MAQQISKIDLSRLRNDEEFQFHTEVDNLANTLPEAVKTAPVYVAYHGAYANLDEAMRKIRGSALTPDIIAADHARDITFGGMIDAQNAAMKHFNPVKAQGARNLKVVFNTFGNVAPLPLNEETSAVYNMVQELKTNHATDVTAAGLDEWVAELDRLNTAFATLYRGRNDEATGKTMLKVKQTRAAIRVAYRQLTIAIDGQAILSADSTYADFITKLNGFVNKYAGILAARAGRKVAANPSTPVSN